MHTILLFGDNCKKDTVLSNLSLKNSRLLIAGDEKELKYLLYEFIPEYLVVNSLHSNQEILKFVEDFPEMKVIIVESSPESGFDKILVEQKYNVFIYKSSAADSLGSLVGVIDRVDNFKIKCTAEQFGTLKDAEDKSSNGCRYINQEIISFYSVQGGVGRTTLALNLVWNLKERLKNIRILFLDLNFTEGYPDSAMWLNLEPVNNLGNFIENISEPSRSFSSSVSKIKNKGIDFIFPPKNLKISDCLDIDMIDELIFQARREYNMIIVDLPNRYDNIFMEMLNLSTIIFLVSSPEINQVLRISDLIKRMPDSPRKMMILNDRKGNGFDPKKMELLKSASLVPVEGYFGSTNRTGRFLKIGRQDSEIVAVDGSINELLDKILAK
jgi:MinD-like ATPase involved in chromosome partitioning or flagellar assembly